MRVKSDLWVSALTRRIFADGGFAVVRHRGAAEAGAIFVIRRARDGALELFGPASQTSYAVDGPSERQLTCLTSGAGEASIEERLERERRFDPDLWVVEIETEKNAEAYLPLADE